MITPPFFCPVGEDRYSLSARSRFSRSGSAYCVTAFGYSHPEKICVAPVNTFEEALQDPHICEQDIWFRGTLPTGETVPQSALPVRFGKSRPGWRTPPPGFGEHNRQILDELGIGEDEFQELKAAGII